MHKQTKREMIPYQHRWVYRASLLEKQQQQWKMMANCHGVCLNCIKATENLRGTPMHRLCEEVMCLSRVSCMGSRDQRVWLQCADCTKEWCVCLESVTWGEGTRLHAPVFQHAQIYTKHTRSEKKAADGNKTQIRWDGMHQFFSMQKSTQNIPEVTYQEQVKVWAQV